MMVTKYVFMETYGELSLNYPGYPFLSEGLRNTQKLNPEKVAQIEISNAFEMIKVVEKSAY